MNYTFPEIYNIDDVLPAIKDSPEFIVAEKDGYKVINYVVAGHDTFPEILMEEDSEYFSEQSYYAAIRRECRGLVFSDEGELINRRYSKFFNVGEREETQLNKIDWSKPHHILEKLDGSMLSPCQINNHIRWISKMGITDTSMQAEVFVASRPKYTEFAQDMLDQGITPIFEWTSNKNRIVLDYPEDNLILTALRFMNNGQYIRYSKMVGAAKSFDIPVVKAWDDNVAHEALINIVRQAENTEGVVVRFEDGHMVKVKSEWYVKIHKVKSLLGQERDVVLLILNNELDDMIPVLPKEDAEKIEKFRDILMNRINVNAKMWNVTIDHYKTKMDRKTFALGSAQNYNPLIRGIIFQFWDKECNEHLTYQTIVDIIKKNCGSNQSYSKVKEAFLKGVDL